MDKFRLMPRKPQISAAALAVMSCFASAAFANPTGGVPVNGTVSMDASIPNQLHITNSPGSVIHWNGFSIGVGELTRFVQESAASAVLNRVVTSNPSEILGTLTSNGRVFLINPNGIAFGSGAVVDVAGLVASSLDLSDTDFLGGNLRFRPVPGAGSVVNDGTIGTPAGGQVYLVGPAVRNGGLISSPQGEVILAAGNSVELMNTGTPGLSVSIDAPANEALNMGRILADSGRIGIFAGAINQRGIVSANTAVAGADGSIKLVATDSTSFAAGSSTTMTGSLEVDTGGLTVAGNVSSGPQAIHATDEVVVQGGRLSASGEQTIAAGALRVLGGAAPSGAATGIFHAGSGEQTIAAQSILVQGGSTGAGNSAQINSASGAQFIDAQSIAVHGGADGTNNFAFLRSQTAPQTITAGELALNAGAGGTSNFAAVLGAQQTVTVGGNLTISGGGSASTPALGGGALIGGGTSLPTSLVLTVGGDATLYGGSIPGSGGAIGASNAGLLPTEILMNVGGNLTMSPGSGTGTRIGVGPANTASGNIEINTGGFLALNSAGPGRDAVIRTADGVTLRASSITQGTDALIEADALNLETTQGALLTGQNVVNTLNATNVWFGDVALHNTSPMLTVTGVQNFGGALRLQQTGDLRVTGSVVSGPQDIDVTGGLFVQNQPFAFTQLSASGGQTIDARYLDVNASDGGGASISNFGGVQTISTTGIDTLGNGLVVRNSGGFVATIDSFMGEQHVHVRNADRVLIDGAAGPAQIVNIDGVQEIALSGGANALVLGTPGALGQSVIGGGGFQTVRAGNPGEQGSITLHGTAGGGFGNTIIVSNPVPGGTQTVSTPGTISVLGGTSPSAPGAAGIFANGFGGQQTISAGALVLQGGAAGSGNSAMIGANSGSQTINAGVGGIEVRGGATGGNNFAMINQASTNPAATQTLTSAGPVHLEGGSGSFNFAMIRGFGGHQDFVAGDTTLLAGAAGIDNFSTIQSRSQDMTVHGDLEITARGSAGTPTVGGGARIGGTGGASPSSTNLRLVVDGDLRMTGGDVSGTGVLLGNTSTIISTTDIDVRAGGDVTLSGGSVPGTFATIGSRAGSLAGGDIAVTANRNIALNSTAPDQASIIRTADAVTLAAQQITQGADARIEAGSLSTTTFSGADLDGANALNAFSAANFGGDLVLHNTSPQLTVTRVDNFSGALSLQQTGDLLVRGLVFSGVQEVDVSSGLIVQNDPGGFAELIAQGGQSIEAGFVEVNAVAGGGASIFSIDGPQSIAASGANAAGESVVVRAAGGFFAQIAGFGGVQSINLTGSGPNALVVGDPGFGSARIGGDTQSIVAGNPGERGSITIAGSGSQIGSNSVPGGTQTVSTSGAITVLGGMAPFGPPTGVFHSGNGQQTVTAQSIVLQGGSGGANNGAQINALSGPQNVQVGTIEMHGGTAGTNNTAILRSGPGLQTIVADQIDVTGGAGGTQNFAVIVSPQQDVTVHGNLTLSGGASLPGTFGGGALLGGGSTAPTDLTLDVGGNVTLNGGSVPIAGAGIGAGSAGGQRTDIIMNVRGDVTLNAGSATGTRIGSPENNVASGEIFVAAGGTIALHSAAPGNAGAIFTNDGVRLTADRIVQGPNSRIQAGSLTTQTAQGTQLGGANSVSELAMANTVAGDVTFNNSSALLTVTGIDQVPAGALSLNQAGNLRIHGDVASGAQSISATGDLTITPGANRNVTVQARGPQTFNVGGSFSLLGGTAWNGYAQTLAKGPVNVTTGGDLNVRGGSGLLAYALLYGSDDIRLTVGDELHVDGGSGLLAFARVQTDLWDRIFLDFPNRASGGYFVNGREGVTHRGLDGLYTGPAPARRGRSLVVTYGE